MSKLKRSKFRFNTIISVKEHSDFIVLKGLWIDKAVRNWCKRQGLTYQNHSQGS